MSRPLAIRRCLRMIDAGASIEHVIGEAYNAGHIAGSGVSLFSEAESDLLASMRLLSDADVALLVSQFPILGETVEFLHTEKSE